VKVNYGSVVNKATGWGMPRNIPTVVCVCVCVCRTKTPCGCFQERGDRLGEAAKDEGVEERHILSIFDRMLTAYHSRQTDNASLSACK